MQTQAVCLEHHTRVGAPPQDGLAEAEPQKNSVDISPQQTGRVQHATGCKQAGRRLTSAPGCLDGRKSLTRREPRNGPGGVPQLHGTNS